MNNLSQNQETSYNDNTDTNETGKYNQPGFAKKVAAIAAGLALTGTIGLGLSACGSDNGNAAPVSETTTSQSSNNNQANNNSQTQANTNNGDTNANNANTDSQAEALISTFKSNFAKSGFTLDSSDAELLQSYKEYNDHGIEADVEFTYNGTVYKGFITTTDNKSYLVEFDSIHFGRQVTTLANTKDGIIEYCLQ